MPSRRIGWFLDPRSIEPGMLARARELIELQRTYAGLVPKGLARSSRPGCLAAGLLVVYADNGAAAAKIRQMVPVLLSEFRKRGWQITSMRVDVQVSAPPRPVPVTPRQLSDVALQQLRALGDALPPSPLQEAVLRLARRAKKSSRAQ